jgi:hypothetical protein
MSWRLEMQVQRVGLGGGWFSPKRNTSHKDVEGDVVQKLTSFRAAIG